MLVNGKRLTGSNNTGSILASVLAPYLLTGVELQNEEGKRFPLTALHLDVSRDYVYYSAQSVFNGSLALMALLPRLRSADQLAQPLENGVIPLCHIAELTFMTKGFEVEADGYSCSMRSRGFRLRLSVNPHTFDLTATEGERRMQPAPIRNQVAIFDYLRANEFALPSHGRTLLEGIDYERKE
jgi:hypothetical protein